jgi:hypothetical protein
MVIWKFTNIDFATKKFGSTILNNTCKTFQVFLKLDMSINMFSLFVHILLGVVVMPYLGFWLRDSIYLTLNHSVIYCQIYESVKNDGSETCAALDDLYINILIRE